MGVKFAHVLGAPLLPARRTPPFVSGPMRLSSPATRMPTSSPSRRSTKPTSDLLKADVKYRFSIDMASLKSG
jgi:hypothetical protein